MTTTIIGSWRGRTLCVRHWTGRHLRWRFDVSPRPRDYAEIFLGWLGQDWPMLLAYGYSLKNPQLRAAVARLIVECGDAGLAQAWLDEIHLQPDDRKLLFTEAIIPFARTWPPGAILRRACPYGGLFRQTVSQILRALGRGVSARLIEESLDYAAITGYNVNLDILRPDSRFDLAASIDLLAHADAGYSWRIPRELWRAQARCPRAEQVFAASWWKQLDEESAYRLLDSACERFTDRASVDAVRRQVEELAQVLIALSPEDRKIANQMEEDECLRINEFLPVHRRLPHPGQERRGHWVGSVFRRLPREHLHGIATAPESSFTQLLKSQKRTGEARLVRQGLRALFRAIPDRAVQVFRLAPKHLFSLAGLAGALHPRHAAAMLRDVANHEFNTAVIADGDIVGLDNLLLRHVELARRLPRFHAWDEHFSGRKLMPPHGVALAFAELREQLALLTMWHAENVVRQHLPYDPHTYAMLRGSRKNRHGLRRFLRGGGIDHIDRHPATQAWLRRHPRVDLGLWRRGVPFTHNGVRLTIERNPLEILKMGTYVASCLSLGAMNAFNAATVVLDVNKQVVFARDAQGRFVARQLLAIDDQDRLVCFRVYATHDTELWEPVFAEYARALAWSLGISVYGAGKYEIAKVIARAWYDDCAWDLASYEERVAA
jgi:hypothetical protein